METLDNMIDQAKRPLFTCSVYIKVASVELDILVNIRQ